MPIWALPNIKLDEPVESQFFALAPHDDVRIRTLKRQHPEFRKFLNRFRDIHHERIYPPLILRHEDAPTDFQSGEAAASFRDILVASIVPYSWAKNLIYANFRYRASTSGYFWIHPWMIDRNFEHAIAFTPTTTSLHEASAVNGQSSPELIPIDVRRGDFDDPLLEALLERFYQRYGARKPSWANIALFRSLNIANQASRIPSNADATIFDFGRIISLWVSAFECLVHPGRHRGVTIREVYSLLENVPWLDKRGSHQRYLTRIGRSRSRRNLACWIYNKIYNARNAFLHGNPVTQSTLKIQRSGRRLIYLAPPLYRLGLTSFLQLKLDQTPPTLANSEAFAAFIAARLSFNQPQEDAEKSIRLALISEERQEAERQDRLARQRQRVREINAGC